MVKRILALSLLMVGLMGLSGCGDGNPSEPTTAIPYGHTTSERMGVAESLDASNTCVTSRCCRDIYSTCTGGSNDNQNYLGVDGHTCISDLTSCYHCINSAQCMAQQ